MTSRDRFPVVTLVLGSILTVVGGLLSEAYRNRWAARKAREDRAIQLIAERTAFQIGTLLKLQEAGKDLLDATGGCFEEKWLQFMYPPAADSDGPKVQFVNAEAERARRKARLQVDILISRVEHDELRERAEKLTGLSGRVIRQERYDHARQELEDMRAQFAEVNRGPVRSTASKPTTS
jgi:hypothetical protein